MKRTVLCFVFDSGRLLMIQKKRGQGAGKWNVPGGKLAEGESPENAAVRETEEETGIRPHALEHAGTLAFHFPEGNSWDNYCEVFVARAHSGALIPETDECSAHWVRETEIPFEKMWDSDRLWLPLLLSGRRFHRVYQFDENDRVIAEEILDDQVNRSEFTR